MGLHDVDFVGNETALETTTTAWSVASAANVNPPARQSLETTTLTPGAETTLPQNSRTTATENRLADIPASRAIEAHWQDELYRELYHAQSPEPAPVAAAASTGLISGRVLTQSGFAVEGIEVTATLRRYFKNPASEIHGNGKTTHETTTNQVGFYAFRDLPAGIYMIGGLDTSGYATSRIEARTGVKYADLVLKRQRYKQVRGIVTDTSGAALEGVRIMPLVKGIPAGTVSNAHGEFDLTISIEREITGFPLRFQARGFRDTRYRVDESDWYEGGIAVIEAVMEPVYEFSTVAGSVKDTAGLPVPGETVRLYSPSLKRNYDALADSAGEYELAGVEIADDYQLWIRPTGPYRDYVEAKISLTPGYTRRNIELERLDRGYRLSGRILDQAGTPIPELTLTVHSKAATAQKLPVTSDAYGNFEVANVPEGELVFESRSMPFYSLSGLHLSGNDTEKHVELVLNRGRHKLLGTVVSSDGTLVATPKIFITSAQVINGMHSRSSSSTRADADGRFVFTDLSPGKHTVTVNAPGYEGVRLTPVVGVQNELLVTLEKNTT